MSYCTLDIYDILSYVGYYVVSVTQNTIHLPEVLL